MKSWQLVAFGVMMGLLSAAVILLIVMRPAGQPIEIIPAPSPSPLLVDVSGEVNSPGLYTLPPNSRVDTAIDAAGGLTENADTTMINLAGWVKDGAKIWVPSVGASRSETIQLPPSNTIAIININTASAKELETLPGIGEVKANQIIAYRSQNGLFMSFEDLLNIPGIGPELLEKIRPNIALTD
ncbi:MAG TPA: helix-hairpin-helix domain-containing protein [Longilinea sp.]|nr:helix-hairpin-helix domain-containing protein [Longilinea sp.]